MDSLCLLPPIHGAKTTKENTNSKDQGGIHMVILSTTYENRAFESLPLAEQYGVENITDNCCILSEGGKVLSFKRKGGENAFKRIAKDFNGNAIPVGANR